jgi:hypothetical protein
MSTEASALSTFPPPAESEYEAIYAAVTESPRGRWFLDQFARRNRSADTLQVLAAIERLESVMRERGGRQPYQTFRAELLEMAATIAQTRAEVVGPDHRSDDRSPPAHGRSDIAAAVQRIQDVAWAMREHGLDPTTCGQIESLASAILSSSWLDRPDDQRAQKLGEVLGYLEHRIGAMLGAGTAEPAASEATAPEPGATAGSLGSDRASLDTEQLAEPDSSSPAPAPETNGSLALPGTDSTALIAISERTAPAESSGDPPPAHAVMPAQHPMLIRPSAADLIPMAELVPLAGNAALATALDAGAPDTKSSDPVAPVADALAALPAQVSTPDLPQNAPEDADRPIESTAASPPPGGPSRGGRSDAGPLLPSDPLGALKAMSEAERIALFM